ncbi:MAG TPA: SCO family protein [Candidatus Angelobacter sp.]|jgi:cytochrome oxidase Cu insertion factor (SCO1/SenC/PrrC family)
MKFRAFVILIIFIFSCSLQGQDQPVPVALSVPDIEVVNQDGRHVRFNSQVVEGRIAIVTGFFTTCSSMCPITQEKLSQVARLLGPRLGKDVVIVSVSVDPENDTPARMKDWAEKFHTGPGWTLLSGNRTEVDTLLKSLGLFVELRQRHQSALMIGSAATGWVRISSWAPSEKLAKVTESMLSAKPVANASIHRQ